MSSGTPPSHAIPDTFSLVVWNVHKDPEAYQDELPRLALSPALVLIQEGVGPNVGAPLDARGEASHVVSFRFVRGGASTGVVTWANTPSLTHVPLRTKAREPFAGTPKTALVSEHPLRRGDTLLVVNLHGINFRAARLLARQLEAVEDVVRPHEGPLIVAGDFNTWSSARRAVVEQFAKRLGLITVFDGPSAPKLDAAFVRGLDVVQAEVVDTEASDHDALLVTLRVVDGS